MIVWVVLNCIELGEPGIVHVPVSTLSPVGKDGEIFVVQAQNYLEAVVPAESMLISDHGKKDQSEESFGEEKCFQENSKHRNTYSSRPISTPKKMAKTGTARGGEREGDAGLEEEGRVKGGARRSRKRE